MSLSVNGGFGSKGGGSNPNLLDNGWFTVNQRGLTSYSSPSSSADIYSVDRWYVYNGSVVVEDGYITITRNNNAIANFGFNNRLEKNLNLAGKTVTLSFMMSDGVILSQTGSFPEDETGNDALNFSYGNTDWLVNLGSRSTYYQVAIYLPNAGDTISIRAIKLEYGTVSTLALDSAPNYTTELLKCQRYYFMHFGGDPSPFMASYISGQGNVICTSFPVPVRMRISPTITLLASSNVTVLTPTARSTVNITGVSSAGYITGNAIDMALNLNTTLTKSVPCAFFGVRIELSADL